MFDALKGWTSAQKHVVAASYLGWTLDAFDFFLLVFVLKDVAAEFGVEKASVAVAITLTLALRPVGAFLFGRLADRFGRRPVLMADVAVYSALGFATAFAPNLTVFLILRALFGVAMGGEWGIGASLTMESIKPEARGIVSGLLQSGYPSGYLIASVVFALLYDHIGWRGMFMVGVIPALLILYIRRHVPESPGWNRKSAQALSFGLAEAALASLYLVTVAAWVFLRPIYGDWMYAVAVLPVVGTLIYFRQHWQLALFVVALMTAFNFFSHGTQDIYPTFLQVQHHFDPHVTGIIAVIYNIGAILGGWTFGLWSQNVGRKRAIIVASLLAIPVAYLWAYSQTATMLTVGAFLMQFFVQGAWGVIPAHLNELSPHDARGTFPGTVYQLGNFIASYNAVLQTSIAAKSGENYSFALASVAVAAAVAIVVLTLMGREARDIKLSGA